MAMQTEPKPVAASRPSPKLHLVEARRRTAQLHLLTYIVGNALVWTLWAMLSVSVERWYWWPIGPMVGWTFVLAGHLWWVCIERLADHRQLSAQARRRRRRAVAQPPRRDLVRRRPK